MYGQKSCFTVQITCNRKTKISTIYPQMEILNTVIPLLNYSTCFWYKNAHFMDRLPFKHLEPPIICSRRHLPKRSFFQMQQVTLFWKQCKTRSASWSEPTFFSTQFIYKNYEISRLKIRSPQCMQPIKFTALPWDSRVYVIVIPWVVRLYVEIIHEL